MKTFGRFYAAMKRVQYCDKDELKRQWVMQFSNGRTEHLHEMQEDEYNKLCSSIERNYPDEASKTYREALRLKRSAVLHLMQKIGVDTSDWSKVNSFCSNKRIAGKEFRELSPEELNQLGKKLRMIQKRNEEKL